MDKPTEKEIQAALRAVDDATPGRPGSYNRALRDLARYWTWAEAELELAAAQEKHLAQTIVDQRTELNDTRVRLISDRNAAVTAHRERNERLETQLADAIEKIRVLQADVVKGRQEFDRRLKAKDARIEEIERDRVRLVAKIEEVERAVSDEEDKSAELRSRASELRTRNRELVGQLAKLRQENERLTTNLVDSRQRDITKGAELSKLRAQSPTAPPQWVPETSAAVLEAQIEALSGEKPKGKSYADAELGVIQDCLEALNRIPAAQRAAVTQYLTSRAHTAAWGAMPQQQAVPPW